MTFFTLTQAADMRDRWAAANPEAYAYLTYCRADADLPAKLYQKQGKPMKPKTEWSFTAKPDFARICRELAAQGANVGRVTEKGGVTVTLFRDTVRAKGRRPFAAAQRVSADWFMVAGDHVQALLEVRPVKVEGFAAPEVGAAPSSPAPKAAPTVWVRSSDDGSVREYLAGSLGPFRGPPSPGTTAWLGLDGKVYPLPTLGRHKIGVHVERGAAPVQPATPASPNGQRWAIFVKNGSRSLRLPNTFPSEQAGLDFLAKIDPYCREVNGYFVRAL